MAQRDLERVIEIAGALETAPHWTRDAYEAAIAPDAPVPRIALVAEINWKVAGFAVASMVAGTAELESIAVAGLAQGRGIGGELIASLVWQLRAAGVSALELEVRESNRAAIRLYARAGFVEVGRRRGYYLVPVEDAMLLRLELGRAASQRVGAISG